jgi:hypothetical protein
MRPRHGRITILNLSVVFLPQYSALQAAIRHDVLVARSADAVA